ncbi:hypothetical protein POPTR_016G031166v4 [Populus trichocarpa]|uniref:Uncharacterized protein n=1 Tax=Populus trichocarpa TaxID=3694 RepID=A0ACC0RS49_POPTR|nr:hypothetical protein BDE02_16G028000 [Populus trichocarpa]KAI9380083.1 hypothetical protein POPTR_016G031166v4 [Populus trichocarpa]
MQLVNAKGLFRRSQAYLKTSELEKAEAEADIKKALAIDPNNRYQREMNQKHLSSCNLKWAIKFLCSYFHIHCSASLKWVMHSY